MQMAPWISTICTICTIAALEDLELRSVDISHAYLNGQLEEEIYMKKPEGFEVGGPEYVCMLDKLLYSLEQASRVWNETLQVVLFSMGSSRYTPTMCLKATVGLGCFFYVSEEGQAGLFPNV
jgi:hypothetical protein